MTLAKKYLFLIQDSPRNHLVIGIIGIYNKIVKYILKSVKVHLNVNCRSVLRLSERVVKSRNFRRTFT